MIRVSWNTASVMAGKVMWCQPLAVNNPVLQNPSWVTSPRPKLGNQPSKTAKINISKIPIKKVGSDTPSNDTIMKIWLVKVPRLSAAYTPIGIPKDKAMTAATSANSSVAGKRSASSPETLTPWRRLRPNSP